LSLLTYLFIFLALILSLAIAYFQYYYKLKNKASHLIFLFILRALGFFLVLLLLINPKIKTRLITNEKPKLSILVDDSKSIEYFKETNSIKDWIKAIESNKALNDKFDITNYSFGNSLSVLNDSITFSQSQTNIADAIEKIGELYKNSNNASVLLTDGNQTVGKDYSFVKPKTTVFPIVFGDTVTYKDLKISQLNVNKYSFINNQFPVEVLLNYEGNETVNTEFRLTKNDRTVYRKNITFSQENNARTLTTKLTSNKEGLQYYKAILAPVSGEKNTQNNQQNFSVEVINEQTKILLLSSTLHPDLGTIKKAIESNKQRKVEIKILNNEDVELNDFQLVVFYQPNNNFKYIFTKVRANKMNYLIVSGTNTDWNFLNNEQLGFSKNAINQTENYSAVFNQNFLTFFQEDLDFENYPPLQDKFGEITVFEENASLLNQSINGVQTGEPLLTFLDKNDAKIGILFGEGIWRWRAQSYLNTNSFEDFDAFIGNVVQYLAFKKKRDRLSIDAESIYNANSAINISAFYTDENYTFDKRVSIEILVKNQETGKEIRVPFSLYNNSYKVTLESLASGNYEYTITVLNQNISKKGNFIISEFEIEEQFVNANEDKLNTLASNTNGTLFYKDQQEQLITTLLNDNRFKTIQKSKEQEQNLIEWKWLLSIIIILFSTEWFLRKYFGKI